MKILQSILAVIGLVAILVAGYGYSQFQGYMAQLDPGARKLYEETFAKFDATKDWADALMWSFKVEEGISPEEVVDSLKSLAYERNFFFAGESPFYKQAEAATGKAYRYVNFLSFCDVRVGMSMADYNDKYTAFMPCRIAVVEDMNGGVWVHSMNLDLVIYGGKPLPQELKEKALTVRNNIYELMQSAAAGEF